MLIRFFISLFALMLSSVSFAVDFSEADALFKQRDGNLQAIEASHALYAKLAAQAKGAELIYAYEQMSRLRFYQGIFVSNRSDKIAIALKCVNDVEAIRSVDGVTPIAYYYWKALCLISWGRHNIDVNPIETLARTSEMAKLVDAGIALDPAYEGGGCYRVGAALYVTLPPINFGGPTRDLDRAERYAELAINSPAYEFEADPETATGDYYYKIYEAKARVQLAQHNEGGAIQTLQSAIGRIQAGDVPVGREPETKIDLRDLQELLNDIQH